MDILRGGFTTTQIAKKAKYYLIPFCSCFLISEVLIRGNTDLLARLEYLAFHLESSLWYLFVLFELSLVHMIAVTIATKVCKNGICNLKSLVVYSIFYGVFLVPFAILALTVGTTFFGGKFVLYYSLFYWLGFAWNIISHFFYDTSEKVKLWTNKAMNVVALATFVIYFVLLSRFNIAELGDGLGDIIVRFIASV